MAIFELFKSQYELFSPLYLMFYSKSAIECDFYGSIHMTGRTEDILQASMWEQEKSIKLVTPKNDDYFEWYKSGYEDFHQMNPELKTMVSGNEKNLMEKSRNEGLLKLVYIGEELIGIISAEKSDFLGSSGLYFNEIHIHKNWKGKGLAKAIQRKFIVGNAKEIEYIWGTIYASNKPSYKTAYSNKRRPVRYECFIRI